MGSKRPGSARVGELRRAQLRCSCELAPTTPSVESGREVGTRQEVSRCDGGIRHVSPGRHAPWLHDVLCDRAGDSRWIAVKSACPIAIYRLRRPTPSCRSSQVARLSDLRRLFLPDRRRRFDCASQLRRQPCPSIRNAPPGGVCHCPRLLVTIGSCRHGLFMKRRSIRASSCAVVTRRLSCVANCPYVSTVQAELSSAFPPTGVQPRSRGYHNRRMTDRYARRDLSSRRMPYAR